MKHYKLTLLLLLLLSSPLLFMACPNRARVITVNAPVIDSLRYKKLGNEALTYCRQNKFNTDFCLLADMSVHSGKYRFFVWNFNKRQITASGLVTHGCGRGAWGTDAVCVPANFSNVEGSHCSSLGKYKIEERGYSEWGMHIKYLLHGLDTTNNNALKRIIVLHSWEAVNDTEVYPQGAPQSWGCPAVSLNFMMKLDTLLQSANKPVLLWMVD